MVSKSLVVLLIGVALRSFVEAQCYYERSIGAGVSVTIDHLSSYGSCTYKVLSSVDTFLQATCTLTLQDTTCNNQIFSVSRTGDINMNDAQNYCSSGSVNLQSIGNEIVVSFMSNWQNYGSFNCKITAIAPTNANCDCGWNKGTKIVGGSPTGVNEFVSHAGLVDSGTRDVFCGATIIKQNWLVTAAHCFDAFPNAGTTAVLVGDHDTSIGSETKWAAAYAVQSYLKHSGYVADTNLNDIALVKTSNYIKFNPGVGPACLPYTFNGYNFDGMSLTAVGWGTTSFAGPSSNVLLKTSLTVVSNAQCASQMNNIDNTKICTYGSKLRDTCGKDSGGGLYFYAGRYYPIGIVNYGIYCASSTPSVNSRFTSYIGWIETNVGGFFCRKT